MRVKVCCIASVEEARLAHDAGADLLGLVSHTLSGAGAISDDRIRAIVDSLPASATPCLLTSELSPHEIARHARSTRVKAVQLVGDISRQDVTALRSLIPGTLLIKVVHVEGPQSVDLASSYDAVADALLLDSVVREPGSDSLGGTGKTHDWNVSRRIVESVTKPVFLAGGLNPWNIEGAIAAVGPGGVDVCSGLRESGALSQSLLTDFVARARAVTGGRGR
ncbi:MAG: phosphoribosylanthranilate isomerase [Candidatus Eisenbacteria bacterium]|uniref:N-(5'-phosphoribosyl)anthranilate isomerase n=1 Tax=Eiseniibacteriota bacterium TaxID=2212470 RepID=A0A956NKM5_UNCEI|nr:phosphoribosylanthranilate isomerase [Candidatus Eisenbacteria bacterium]